jgi:hypothetical protein
MSERSRFCAAVVSRGMLRAGALVSAIFIAAFAGAASAPSPSHWGTYLNNIVFEAAGFHASPRRLSLQR